MSQDDEKCAKCGKSCGYDDNKGHWDGWNLAICSQCKRNLINKFCAFFGLKSASSDDYGLTVDWEDADKILNKIKVDYAMRISYLVTDKELYERHQTLPVIFIKGYCVRSK